MAKVEVSDVIIDCADPHRLAAFWSELLGRPVAGAKGPYVWLEHAPGVIGLGFQQVTEPKTGKNRVHVDISGPDIAEIKRRVEALGGRRVEGYEAGGFLVMADPEDNVFCVVPERFEFDEGGRTNYLEDGEVRCRRERPARVPPDKTVRGVIRVAVLARHTERRAVDI